MDLEEIRLRNILYRIESCVINIGSDTEFEVPKAMISSIQIDNNYETSMFPFFYMGINLPSWVYIELTKHPDEVFISLDLKAHTFRNDANEEPVGTFTEYKGKYKAITAVDTPVTDELIQTMLSKQSGSWKKTYEYGEIYFAEFTLFNPSSYAALSKTLNAVITSASMSSIVTYVLQYGGFPNILMSPLDNRNTYSEFKVWPIDAVDIMKTLIYNFKLHNGGTVFFMDLDRTFVISKQIKCTAWAKGEYKTVNVMSLSNYNETLGLYNGYYMNSKEKFHLLNVESSGFELDDNTNLPQSQTNQPIPGKGKILTFRTSCALMECLTPNKEFIVDIDSASAMAAKLNGKYRIIRATLNLTQSGEYMQPEFHVFLWQ